jgi:hypothetical protein
MTGAEVRHEALAAGMVLNPPGPLIWLEATLRHGWNSAIRKSAVSHPLEPVLRRTLTKDRPFASRIGTYRLPLHGRRHAASAVAWKSFDTAAECGSPNSNWRLLRSGAPEVLTSDHLEITF